MAGVAEFPDVCRSRPGMNTLQGSTIRFLVSTFSLPSALCRQFVTVPVPVANTSPSTHPLCLLHSGGSPAGLLPGSHPAPHLVSMRTTHVRDTPRTHMRGKTLVWGAVMFVIWGVSRGTHWLKLQTVTGASFCGCNECSEHNSSR